MFFYCLATRCYDIPAPPRSYGLAFKPDPRFQPQAYHVKAFANV